MASKRRKKHAQQVVKQQAQKKQTRQQARSKSKGEVVTDYLRKQIKKANSRLLRLEKAGIKNTIYTQTVAALGRSRFLTPQNAEDVRLTKLILSKFLGSKGSTVKAAKAQITKNRHDFAEFLRRATSYNISDSTAELVSKRLGDLELKELIGSYTYNEIRDSILSLENSGIDATPNNVIRALQTDIDNVIEDEFKRRGVNVTYDLMSEAIDIAIKQNIDVAIDFVNQTLEKRGTSK